MPTYDLVAATAFSGPAKTGRTLSAPLPTGLSVTFRTAMGTALFGGLLQGREVGAAARLRKGDTGEILKPELGAINQSDRRADRGNRQPGLRLHQVFEEGRGMIRGTTGAGHDASNIVLSQLAANLQIGLGPGNLPCRISGISAISDAIFVM